MMRKNLILLWTVLTLTMITNAQSVRLSENLESKKTPSEWTIIKNGNEFIWSLNTNQNNEKISTLSKCNKNITLPYEQDFENGLPESYILEDADGDGLNWGLDAQTSYAHSGVNLVTSLSNSFYGVENLNNWLILPAFTVGSNYTELTFWAGGLQSNEKYDVLISTSGTAIANFNSVFSVITNVEEDFVKQTIDLSNYAGQSINIAFRHYDVQYESNGLRLDDIAIKEYSDPEIEVSNEDLTFDEILSGTDQTLETFVYGHLLTTNITVNTIAPFSISTDNATFGTTATLPAAGGNLYVKYAPTAEGEHTGNLTLTSGQTTTNIGLSGKAYVCNPITEFPHVEGFEYDGIPHCWSLLDADFDGSNWESICIPGVENEYAHSGMGLMASASYINQFGPLNPDNWLISPAIQTGDKDLKISYWVSALDPTCLDYYGIYVSTSGIMPEDFTCLFEGDNSSSWEERNVVLGPEYHNKTIYIAFRHFDSSDNYMIFLDDVTFSEIEGTGIEDFTESQVKVYPSPAHNILKINANEDIESITVFDMTGSQVGFYNGNGQTTQINISDLSNGMYFLKIKTEKGMITKKINVVK